MNYTHRLFISFLILLGACKVPYVVNSHTDSHYPIHTTISDSLSDMELLLLPYRDSISGIMNEVIGQAAGNLKKEKPSSSLGNLVVTAMLQRANDIHPNTIGSIANYGGIRIPSIQQGPITIGKIYELLPFENEMVLIDVNKKDLDAWMKLIMDAQGWPLKFSMPLSALQNSTDTIYTIATNDYIANGGDNCDFLKKCKRIQTGLLIRDIVIDYIKVEKNIIPDNSNPFDFEKK